MIVFLILLEKELILKQSLKHKNLININEKNIFKNYLKSYLLKRSSSHS